MKKTTFILCLLSINLLAVSETEMKEMNKNISDLETKHKSFMENTKNSSIISIEDALKNSKNILKNKDTKPNIKKDERKEEIINDPLKRAETVNKKEIERNKAEISKKSVNMANFYEFLSLYGKLPEEKGKLPKEQELYKIMKENKIKISSEKVINKPTQLKEKISR